MPLLTKFSINIEIFGLDDMMLLSFENFFLFKLFQVIFLLHVERSSELFLLFFNSITSYLGGRSEFLRFLDGSLFELILRL